VYEGGGRPVAALRGQEEIAMLKSPVLLLCAAAAALAAAPTAALAAATKLAGTLTGANEPAGGDPAGNGRFSAEVDPDTGDFCYTLSATGFTATAAHVHTGAAGKEGPPVITLTVTGEGADECVAVEPDKLKAILAAPGDYYVNVHSAAFPKGAIRSQLSQVK